MNYDLINIIGPILVVGRAPQPKCECTDGFNLNPISVARLVESALEQLDLADPS
jgi:hypothetical protein